MCFSVYLKENFKKVMLKQRRVKDIKRSKLSALNLNW